MGNQITIKILRLIFFVICTIAVLIIPSIDSNLRTFLFGLCIILSMWAGMALWLSTRFGRGRFIFGVFLNAAISIIMLIIGYANISLLEEIIIGFWALFGLEVSSLNLVYSERVTIFLIYGFLIYLICSVIVFLNWGENVDDTEAKKTSDRWWNQIALILLIITLPIGFGVILAFTEPQPLPIADSVTPSITRDEILDNNLLIPIERDGQPPLAELQKYETSVQDYQACLDAGGCDGQPWRDGDGNDYGLKPSSIMDPVTRVTRAEAKQFCEWLGDARLPSQSEFEQAHDNIGNILLPYTSEVRSVHGDQQDMLFHFLANNAAEWVGDNANCAGSYICTFGSSFGVARSLESLLQSTASSTRRSYIGFRCANDIERN